MLEWGLELSPNNSHLYKDRRHCFFINAVIKCLDSQPGLDVATELTIHSPLVPSAACAGLW
jgi:hypothetical protein